MKEWTISEMSWVNTTEPDAAVLQYERIFISVHTVEGEEQNQSQPRLALLPPDRLPIAPLHEGFKIIARPNTVTNRISRQEAAIVLSLNDSFKY